MAAELTARQTRVLNFIRSFIAKKQESPSVRDIMRGMRIGCPNGVMYHLRTLEQKGLIARQPHIPRSIRVLSQ